MSDACIVKDYQLWNKLGATLANGGRSEDAIHAYYRALELQSGFVRARYNLGVSCIHIGCYQEAAEHFLSALTMHATVPHQKNISNNLWDTLRRTLILMDRGDLADQTKTRELVVFRREFDF
jgi:peroxin-5